MANKETTSAKRGYTISQFCDAWGLSRSTVYRLFKADELEPMKVGTRTLITAESIEQWAGRAKARATRRAA